MLQYFYSISFRTLQRFIFFPLSSVCRFALNSLTFFNFSCISYIYIYLYIYQYHFSLCLHFLLNIQSSRNSVSSVVCHTLDNSPLFTVHHVCFIILTLKLNPHLYFKYVHLCLRLFVLIFFLIFLVTTECSCLLHSLFLSPRGNK
jgi:hypothetical protein